MDNKTDDNSNINLVYISTSLLTGGAEIVLFQLISKLLPNYKINVISLSSIAKTSYNWNYIVDDFIDIIS